MNCTHMSGGLQLLIHHHGCWVLRCLRCGEETPVEAASFPESAGQAAARAVLALEQRRYDEAAAGFRDAAQLGGDPRCHFAALLCRLGVQWCGDEFQPTFCAPDLPWQELAKSEEWLALAACAEQLPPYAWQGLNDVRRQLETILRSIREGEGRSGCDVFLCYRRTPGNITTAMKLCRDLKKQGLRVFCADVSTRGKTQEEFEAEVFHALQTAEYLVLFPGDGQDAMTPWLHNELSRAACPEKNRFICSDGHPTLPDVAGEVTSLEDIRMRLSRFSAVCTPENLFDRGVTALKTPDGQREALALMRRASAHESPAARLLLATLFEEGAIVPADPGRAAHYRHLLGTPDADCRQKVFSALNDAEEALHIARRRALIYVAADVSDAGLSASQALLQPLLTALQADRRLAGCDVCLVGYDRHARIIAPPKALAKYGYAENAVRLMHTLGEKGRDRYAYAAKGLRLCADHLLHNGSDGRAPAIILLTSGAGTDAPGSIAAARVAADAAIPGLFLSSLSSPAQLPGCICGLLNAIC